MPESQAAPDLPADPAADHGPEHGDVWVIVPVYNEATVVAAVVSEIVQTFPNVVCVDDGSGDDSAGQIAATRAHLVHHPINLGQGAALQTGLSYARARPGGRYFVTFDADGQHRVDDAVRMVEVARSGVADVVLGSRFLNQNTEIPWPKRLILRTVVALSPPSRRLQLSDAHNGLRVFTRPVADNLKITMNDMAHASEIIGFLAGSRWRVQEVPVTVNYTDYSKSKGQSLVNGVNILFDLSMKQRKG